MDMIIRARYRIQRMALYLVAELITLVEVLITNRLYKVARPRDLHVALIQRLQSMSN